MQLSSNPSLGPIPIPRDVEHESVASVRTPSTSASRADSASAPHHLTPAAHLTVQNQSATSVSSAATRPRVETQPFRISYPPDISEQFSPEEAAAAFTSESSRDCKRRESNSGGKCSSRSCKRKKRPYDRLSSSSSTEQPPYVRSRSSSNDPSPILAPTRLLRPPSTCNAAGEPVAMQCDDDCDADSVVGTSRASSARSSQVSDQLMVARFRADSGFESRRDSPG